MKKLFILLFCISGLATCLFFACKPTISSQTSSSTQPETHEESICGNGVIDDGEICDGEPGCSADCKSIIPREDGASCSCSAECKSGYCVAGICTSN